MLFCSPYHDLISLYGGAANHHDLISLYGGHGDAGDDIPWNVVFDGGDDTLMSSYAGGGFTSLLVYCGGFVTNGWYGGAVGGIYDQLLWRGAKNEKNHIYIGMLELEIRNIQRKHLQNIILTKYML